MPRSIPSRQLVRSSPEKESAKLKNQLARLVGLWAEPQKGSQCPRYTAVNPGGTILSHMLHVAVKPKRLSDNPCRAVEFPISLATLTRKPHYMTPSEQAKIELAAPNYLRTIVVILPETGPRYEEELPPMKKAQVDLENALVHIADSKTARGIGDVLTTAVARKAFHRQIEETTESEYLFPSPKSTGSKPYLTNRRKAWSATLKGAFRTLLFTSCVAPLLAG
jgi:hypothetical protein